MCVLSMSCLMGRNKKILIYGTVNKKHDALIIQKFDYGLKTYAK